MCQIRMYWGALCRKVVEISAVLENWILLVAWNITYISPYSNDKLWQTSEFFLLDWDAWLFQWRMFLADHLWLVYKGLLELLHIAESVMYHSIKLSLLGPLWWQWSRVSRQRMSWLTNHCLLFLQSLCTTDVVQFQTKRFLKAPGTNQLHFICT